MGKLEQDVRSLGAGRDLPHQLLEHCLGPRHVAREAMEASSPKTPLPGQGRIVGSSLRRQLKELRGRGG